MEMGKEAKDNVVDLVKKCEQGGGVEKQVKRSRKCAVLDGSICVLFLFSTFWVYF